MEANQEITDRPNRLVQLFHLAGQSLVLTDQSRKLQAEKGYRLA